LREKYPNFLLYPLLYLSYHENFGLVWSRAEQVHSEDPRALFEILPVDWFGMEIIKNKIRDTRESVFCSTKAHGLFYERSRDVIQ